MHGLWRWLQAQRLSPSHCQGSPPACPSRSPFLLPTGPAPISSPPHPPPPHLPIHPWDPPAPSLGQGGPGWLSCEFGAVHSHGETCTSLLQTLYFSFIKTSYIFLVHQTDKWAKKRLLAISCASCPLLLSPWWWLRAEEAGIAYKFPPSFNKYLYYLAVSPSSLSGCCRLLLAHLVACCPPGRRDKLKFSFLWGINCGTAPGRQQSAGGSAGVEKTPLWGLFAALHHHAGSQMNSIY